MITDSNGRARVSLHISQGHLLLRLAHFPGSGYQVKGFGGIEVEGIPAPAGGVLLGLPTYAAVCEGAARSVRHTLGEVDRQLGVNDAPVLAPASLFSGNIHHSQV